MSFVFEHEPSPIVQLHRGFKSEVIYYQLPASQRPKISPNILPHDNMYCLSFIPDVRLFFCTTTTPGPWTMGHGWFTARSNRFDFDGDGSLNAEETSCMVKSRWANGC